MDYSKVLKKPIYTEKSLSKATQSIYTFEVGRQASKDEIKKAVEKIFDVTVRSVRVLPKKSKTKRVGKARYQVKTQAGKKAEVAVNGKISLWEVPEEKEIKTKAKDEKKEDKEKMKERKGNFKGTPKVSP